MQEQTHETFVLIEKQNGDLRIGVQEAKLQLIIVECYQCRRKNQCPSKAQFMKCGYCSQINKIYDADPLFFKEASCQRCQKKITIQKNATMITQLVDYSDEETPQQITHMSGFYPCYCKIDITNQLKSVQLSALSDLQEYHISLSNNFQLNYHQIKEFLQSAKDDIMMNKFKCSLEKQSSILYNKTTNKTYSVLKVNKNVKLLSDLMKQLDNIIRLFDRKYQNYQNPIVHCTIAHSQIQYETPNEQSLDIHRFYIIIGKQCNVIDL